MNDSYIKSKSLEYTLKAFRFYINIQFKFLIYLTTFLVNVPIPSPIIIMPIKISRLVKI